MSVLFREYDLLANSGLFDGEYYVRNNPDIAHLNVDPVLHYLEVGAKKALNPSAKFDAAFYLEQCQLSGESPDNPLIHYITVGASRGLRPNRAQAGGVLCSIDRVSLAPLANSLRRLTLEGWALAEGQISRISVAYQGVVLGQALTGLTRTDVSTSHPHHAFSSNSGFSFAAEVSAEFGEEKRVLELTLIADDGEEHVHDLKVEIDPKAYAPAPVLPAPRDSMLAPMRLEIDEASVDESAILSLSGWAVCLLDVLSVRVAVDGEEIGTADYGRTRRDVAAARKEYPRALESGFSFNADLTRFGAGERTLEVTVSARRGITRDAVLRIVVPEPMSPFDAASIFHFHCDAIEAYTTGTVKITGWVITGTVTESITVLLDGQEIGIAQIGLERVDVGHAFPGIAYGRNSGFTFRQAVVGGVASGEHLITLVVRNAAGHLRQVPLPVHATDIPTASSTAVGDAPHAALLEDDERISMSLDSPRLTGAMADTPIISSLSINGWAFSKAGLASVSISIDGEPVAKAQHGIRRDDVASAFPDRPEAVESGFATLIPHWLLSKGEHTVSICVLDHTGRTATIEFGIVVEEIPEGEGPWSLRRKMSQAEVDLQMSVLAGLRWRPHFAVFVAADAHESARACLLETILSLRSQAYGNWRAIILSRPGQRFSEAWLAAIAAEIDDIADKVSFCASEEAVDFVRTARAPVGRPDIWVAAVCAGDQFGVDALLEFALASGLNRSANFLFSDERCFNPTTASIQAYFKPGWSPDLLLSTNYIGRSWCADAALLGRQGLTPRYWLAHGDYDLTLRATEGASGIAHVAKVLSERGQGSRDEEEERQALTLALKRRNLPGEIGNGFAPGFYRFKATKKNYGRVSIIIPTRASRGLIKVCLKTLKEKTAYRDFEIICIENIPAEQPEAKAWLRANADTVLETNEPFNWSRYNNLCAQRASGKYLLFLNDDIEILDPEWLDSMLAIAVRSDVGIVGPQLLYPDGTVQHAGLALTDVIGRARHVFRHGQANDPGYFGLALTQRNVIAVTGACMLMRRQVFDALGGFDEAYNVINNDLDFCLQAGKRGLLIVYTPHAQLVHHEMISRAKLGDAFDSGAFVATWRDLFVRGDPYLNKNISRQSDDLVPEREPVAALCTGNPLFARDSIRRLLIMKLDHIGDCILSLPAVRKLRRYFPKARITVLCGSATRSVWSMEPTVDEVLEFNFFHARSQLGKVELAQEELDALRERLTPRRFDLAVDLRKSADTRHVLQHTGAKYLAGFDHEARFPWLDVALQWEGDPSRVSKRQSVADDLINLVDALSASADNERARLNREPGALSALSQADCAGLFDKPLVCIHAGAGNELKAWPVESFQKLIDLLIDGNDVQVAMVGGPAEVLLSDEVIAGIRHPGRIRNLAGKLSLNALPDLLLRARLFIGNDSGPKHIAAALGVPTVGIHSGNIDPREWGPVGQNAIAIVRQTSCSPCYIDKASNCPRNVECLKGIGAGEVYLQCHKLLNIGAPEPALAPEIGEVSLFKGIHNTARLLASLKVLGKDESHELPAPI